MNSTTRQTVVYFWKMSHRYPLYLYGTLILIGVGTFFRDIVFGLVFRQFFDTLSNGPSPAVLTPLIYVFVGFIMAFIGLNIGYRVGHFMLNFFQPSVMRDIENDVFAKLQQHSYAFFANNFSGALVSKTKRLVNSFERIHDTINWELMPTAITIISSIVVLSFFSWILGVMMFVWVFIYIVVFIPLYRWKFRFDEANAAADSKVTAQLSDAVNNVVTTKIFAKKKFEINAFGRVSYDRYLKRKRAWDKGSWIDVLQGFVVSIAEIIMFVVAVYLWYNGQVSLGTLVLLQIYMFSVVEGVWRLGRVMRGMFESFADAQEMIEIINEPPSLVDPTNPEKCTIKQGAIVFDKVGFAYDGKAVFTKFNLTIDSKESIGLVGESGAGKSTITKMLLRFADISSGAVRIDGQDIRNITQEDLRKKIAYVPQDSMLFHRTLRENIAYAHPDASMKKIVQAAKKASIHKFITSLPDGYETLVGERGIKLSGGERQRVAIARAMLEDAPIVILDEATSSLDSTSEQLIQKAIENLMKNKTTIIIAHRLSTIKKVDRIIVLDRGNIAEQGKHTSLVRKKGKYYQLWKHQSSNI